MQILTEKTDYYFRFVEDIEDRLDYVFNHPDMDEIKNIQKNKRFLKLENVITDGPKYGITESRKQEGEYYFVNIQDVSDFGEIMIEGASKINYAPEEYLLEKNDILISRSRLVGKVGLVGKEVHNVTYGSYLLRIKINEKQYDPKFIVYYLNSFIGQKQFLLLRTGSSGENINIEQIKKIVIPIFTKINKLI